MEPIGQVSSCSNKPTFSKQKTANSRLYVWSTGYSSILGQSHHPIVLYSEVFYRFPAIHGINRDDVAIQHQRAETFKNRRDLIRFVWGLSPSERGSPAFSPGEFNLRPVYHRQRH